MYDSLTNSVVKYHSGGLSGYYAGGTASLVQGDPAYDDYLYIGGHIAKKDDEAHLAIFSYDYATSETILNLIVYDKTGSDDCDYTRGANLNEQAQYISHLGYMYDSGMARGVLFGVTMALDYSRG